MKTTTQAHAILSADSYNTYPKEDWQDGVMVEGIRIEILDQVNIYVSGYQGTLYRNASSGELVVAHRGTEFDRELVKDGLLADAGMVFKPE